MDDQNNNPYPTSQPVPPAQPVQPVSPSQSMPPMQPVQPVPLAQPATPVSPTPPAPVAEPAQLAQPTEPAQPSTADTQPNPPAQPESTPAQSPVQTSGMMDFQHVPKPGEQVVGMPKKKSKGGLIIGIIIGLLLIVGVIVAVALMTMGGGDDDIDLFESKAFFISDDDMHYALFNDDGEQLSEFKYSFASTFIAGTAVVGIDENDQYGIINDEGKMTVDFGKYTYIGRAGALYQATDSSFNEYIINGKGKKIMKLDGGSIINYGNDYAIATDKKGFIIMDYKGKTLLTISENLDKDLAVPGYGSKDGYFTVYHAGINYVFNALKGSLVTKLESSDKYRVDAVDSKNDIIVLKVEDDDAYLPVLDDSSSRMSKYKILVGGELKDAPSNCNYISAEGEEGLACGTDDGSYLLKPDLSIGFGLYDVLYIDAENYAENESDKSGNSSVAFYKNGAKVASVECRLLYSYGKMESNIYLLRTSYSSKCSKAGIAYGRYEFYSAEGKKLFGTDFDDAEAFNKNGLALVSGGEGKKDYLINTENEKVGDEYDYLYQRWTNDIVYYYSIENARDYLGKGKIINSDGEVVADYTGRHFGGGSYNGLAFVSFYDEKGTYHVFDLKGKKETTTSDESPDFYDHYFITTNGKVRNYYTYNGKQFYARSE